MFNQLCLRKSLFFLLVLSMVLLGSCNFPTPAPDNPCDPEDLVSPELLEPEDGAEVQASASLAGDLPILRWSYAAECELSGFIIELSTDETFGTLDYATHTEGDVLEWQVEEDLLEDTTYYWRVAAEAGLVPGPYSEASEFIAVAVAEGQPGVITGVVWDDQCINPIPRYNYPLEDDPPDGCIRVADSIQADGERAAAEPGLDQVQVLVAQGECPAAEEGVLASSGPTDEDGVYYYYAPVGTYCVSVNALVGPNVAHMGMGIWSAPDMRNPAAQTVTISEPGEIVEEVNFGWDFDLEEGPEKASISGKIGEDEDKSASLEQAEQGIFGAELWLSSGACDPEWNNKRPGFDPTTRTDAEGIFGVSSTEVDCQNFADLNPGTYCLVVDPGDRDYSMIFNRGYWTFPIEDEQLPAVTLELEPGEQAWVEFGWHYPPHFEPDNYANCRSGYSTEYEVLDGLHENVNYWLAGRNADNTWWKTESGCWVFDDVGRMYGDPEELPVLSVQPPTEIPPSPVPTSTTTPVPDDNVFPIVDVTAPAYAFEGDTLRFEATAFDNVFVAAITIWVKSSTASKFTAVGVCLETETCVVDGGPFPYGEGQYYATAVDSSGNKSQSLIRSFHITTP